MPTLARFYGIVIRMYFWDRSTIRHIYTRFTEKTPPLLILGRAKQSTVTCPPALPIWCANGSASTAASY